MTKSAIQGDFGASFQETSKIVKMPKMANFGHFLRFLIVAGRSFLKTLIFKVPRPLLLLNQKMTLKIVIFDNF